MSRTKKVYTPKQQAKRLAAALKNLSTSHKMRGKMRRNGLAQPTLVQPTKSELAALTAKWYKKVAVAELAKPEDDRWKDIEYAVDPDSPHIARPSSRGRAYDSTKQIYFALCRNFLTHFRFRSKQEKLAWTMHTNGASYRKILTALKKQYGVNKSIYWCFYYVGDTRAKCMAWNATNENGMLNPSNQDCIQDDAMTGNWSLQLDPGYWQSFKRTQ